jgi:hypothetical protein
MFDLSIPDSLSSKILGFASNLSDKNFLRIVDTLAKLTSIEWHDKGIAAMRQLIADKHPGIAGARRALQKVNPKVRGKLFNNYLLRGVLLGYKKRLAFYNEFNVAPPGNLMISPTTSCNLRCYGCYAGTHIRTDELTQAEVEHMIEEAGKAGTNLVTFLMMRRLRVWPSLAMPSSPLALTALRNLPMAARARALTRALSRLCVN